MMMYALGLIVCFALGWIALRLIVPKLSINLSIVLALALGFGIIGQIGFYGRIILGTGEHWVLPVIGLVLLALLAFKSKRNNLIPASIPIATWWPLALLSLPLLIEAFYFPMGGWDAWSCWNLKLKFLYFGGDQWKNMFDPLLWRSNTHYPLQLPLINLWFWDWAGPQEWIAMINAVLLTLITAGILLFALMELAVTPLIAAGALGIAFFIPFIITLSISQYSDVCVALYALAALVCFLLGDSKKDPGLKNLAMIFLGPLSFSKSEGLVAALIIFGLSVILEYKNKKQMAQMIKFFLCAMIPTIIYTLFIAPHNAAFTNGLTSTDHPSDWNRLSLIAVYPFRVEFLNPAWNGLWILIAAGIIAAWNNIWKGTLKIFGIFVLMYLTVVFAYYFINTFFPILWWMSTTLNRILVALVPTLIFWLTLALAKK